jgi:hypothetical protein
VIDFAAFLEQLDEIPKTWHYDVSFGQRSRTRVSASERSVFYFYGRAYTKAATIMTAGRACRGRGRITL